MLVTDNMVRLTSTSRSCLIIAFVWVGRLDRSSKTFCSPAPSWRTVKTFKCILIIRLTCSRFVKERRKHVFAVEVVARIQLFPIYHFYRLICTTGMKFTVLPSLIYKVYCCRRHAECCGQSCLHTSRYMRDTSVMCTYVILENDHQNLSDWWSYQGSDKMTRVSIQYPTLSHSLKSGWSR